MITMDHVSVFIGQDPIEQVNDTPGYSAWVASLPREQCHVDVAYSTKIRQTNRRCDKIRR